LGRKAPTLNIGEEFEGLPICACYKYLGLWIDQKLTMELQLDHIKKKADWISVKLWPVAKKVSMEYRKNLWKILIRPLFEQLTLLWEMEESKTQQAKVECLLRGTFKKLTLLKKNVSNEIIGDLMQFELENRCKLNLINAQEKWEARVKKKMYTENDSKFIQALKDRNRKRSPRILPRQLQELLNITTAKCPMCRGRVCSAEHMEIIHNIKIPEYAEMIAEVEERTKMAKSLKYTRKEALGYIGEFFSPFLNSMHEFLNAQLS